MDSARSGVRAYECSGESAGDGRDGPKRCAASTSPLACASACSTAARCREAAHQAAAALPLVNTGLDGLVDHALSAQVMREALVDFRLLVASTDVLPSPIDHREVNGFTGRERQA